MVSPAPEKLWDAQEELTPLVPLHLVSLPVQAPELHCDTGCFFKSDLAVWRIGARLGVAAVAKATYTLSPGVLRPHPIQAQIDRHERQWDDNPTRSVAVMSDVVPYKARAEALVVGSAFLPRRTGGYVARLAVGSLEHAVRVHPDRFIQAGGGIVSRDTASRIPLRWERSAGGPGTRNPAGLATSRANPGRLPNFELEGSRVGMAGFGPIPCLWPSRLSEAGSATPADARGMMRTRCLSTEVSAAFFNYAPIGQQFDKFRDGETILVEGLCRGRTSLEFTLPQLHPHAWFVEEGVGAAEAQLKLDTLTIDTDRNLITLLWRGFYAFRELGARVSVVVSDRKTDNPWARSSSYVRGIVRPRSARPQAGAVDPGGALVFPAPPRLPSDA